MTIIAFIASVAACGLLLSFLPTDHVSNTDRPDYHLVPFAGDVLGA